MKYFISILFFLICLPLLAEIIETTDGRKIQLNDDGTYNVLENDNSNVIKTSTITCKANDSERVYILKNFNGIQQALGEDYDVKFNESEIQLSGRFEILITYSMDYIINGKKYGTCSHEGLKEVVESLGIKFE